MYTTLEILKNGNACTGGYGRMLSFFTTRMKFKTMPIPLWMVALVGTHDDMEWATANAMVIDPTMFADFRKRTILSVVKSKFWNNFQNNWPDANRNKLCRDATHEAMRLKTPEEAEAWLVKWGAYHFAHELWSEVIENEIFHMPHRYVVYVQENQSRTAALKHRNWCDVKCEEHYFPWAEGKSASENFAMLCVDGDPYAMMVEIMMQTKLSASRGLNISTIEEGNVRKYMATINVSDPKRIFQMSHLMLSDQLDVCEVTGVNAVLNAASNHIGRVGDDIDPDDNRAAIEAMQRIIQQNRATTLLPATAATAVPVNEAPASPTAPSSDEESWDAPPPRPRATRASPTRRRVPVRTEEDEDDDN